MRVYNPQGEARLVVMVDGERIAINFDHNGEAVIPDDKVDAIMAICPNIEPLQIINDEEIENAV